MSRRVLGHSFAEAADGMLGVVDRAYPDRVAEYVAYQVDLCRVVDPELFVAVDIDAFAVDVERRWRAGELDDLWAALGGQDAS